MDGETSHEANLVRAAIEGNVGAFAQLVGEHRARVLRTAYGIVGSTEEAEDVAQEVFIKVWNSLPGQRREGAFSSWLYRITVNTAIDAVRRRRASAPLDEALATPGDPPEEAALHAEERRRVRRAIAELPEQARATLILREYEGLSYREIAEVLEIPIGTVMSRLNYARRALQKRLEGS